jgi:hypothetical protein
MAYDFETKATLFESDGKKSKNRINESRFCGKGIAWFRCEIEGCKAPMLDFP